MHIFQVPGIAKFASGKALKMLNDFSTYDAIYSFGAMDPASVCGFGVGAGKMILYRTF